MVITDWNKTEQLRLRKIDESIVAVIRGETHLVFEDLGFETLGQEQYLETRFNQFNIDQHNWFDNHQKNWLDLTVATPNQLVLPLAIGWTQNEDNQEEVNNELTIIEVHSDSSDSVALEPLVDSDNASSLFYSTAVTNESSNDSKDWSSAADTDETKDSDSFKKKLRNFRFKWGNFGTSTKKEKKLITRGSI